MILNSCIERRLVKWNQPHPKLKAGPAQYILGPSTIKIRHFYNLNEIFYIKILINIIFYMCVGD